MIFWKNQLATPLKTPSLSSLSRPIVPETFSQKGQNLSPSTSPPFLLMLSQLVTSDKRLFSALINNVIAGLAYQRNGLFHQR